MTRTRHKTADEFFHITGIQYMDQLPDYWWKLRPEDSGAYIGDDVWVTPDGEFVDDDHDEECPHRTRP